MRGVFFAGAAVSLLPLLTLGIFNGLSILGLAIVAFAVAAIIRRERNA
jgi:hypothetical protein